MGMCYADFCRLEPDEFQAAMQAWADAREAQGQADWERLRVHAAITVQPHLRKKLTPRALLPLPWDGRRPRAGRDTGTPGPDERRRLMAEAVRRMGETY